MTKNRSIVSNAALSILGQLVPAIVAIFVLPLLARALGMEQLGFLSLVWVVIGYFSILDLGLGLGVTRSVASVIDTPRESQVPRIFWTAWVAQGLISFVGGSLLWVLTPCVVHSVLHVQGVMAVEAHHALLLCAASMPVIIMTPSLTAILQATRRFDLMVLIQTPFAIGQYIFPYLCARHGIRIDGIIAVLLLSRVISFVLLSWACSRLFPDLIRPPLFSLDEFRNLIGFGSWVTVGTLIAPVVLYFDRFIISRSLSLSDVPFYAVPADALIRVLIVPTSIVSVVFPSFSQMKARLDSGSVRSLARQAIRAVFYLMVVPLGAIILCAPDLMTFWMGASFAVKAAPVLRILAFGALANSLARIPFGLLQAVGRPDLPRRLQLIELPCQIGLAWILTVNFGLRGTAFAWSVRLTIEMMVLLYLAQKNRVLVFTGSGLFRGFAVGGSILITATILPLILNAGLNPYTRFAIDMVWIVASVSVIYCCGLSSADRKSALRLIPRTS